jgi:hypothetical protein
MKTVVPAGIVTEVTFDAEFQAGASDIWSLKAFRSEDEK